VLVAVEFLDTGLDKVVVFVVVAVTFDFGVDEVDLIVEVNVLAIVLIIVLNVLDTTLIVVLVAVVVGLGGSDGVEG